MSTDGGRLLPKFLRRTLQDIMMFAHVRAIRRKLPQTSQERAIEDFRMEYGIRPEDFNIASQITRYRRMEREYYEHLADNGKAQEEA